MDFKEQKKDPNFIFKLERNIKAYMLYMIIILGVISTLLAIAIISLAPIKEVRPYLVTFSNNESNFVKIKQANENISSDIGLVKNILASYVINRETINRINDIARMEIVRIQSDRSVWETLENVMADKNSIYRTQNLYRAVTIHSVNLFKQEEDQVALIAFSIEQTNKARTELKILKYQAAIKYDFEKEENSQDIYDANDKNPTGFKVKEYALSKVIDQSKKKEEE